jgi:hypothetical protein
MDSSMIGKIAKAKRYAEQRDRITFNDFRVTLRGVHADHVVLYREGQWQCDCDFFTQRGVCSHTMAMERVLDGMISPAQQIVQELEQVA